MARIFALLILVAALTGAAAGERFPTLQPDQMNADQKKLLEAFHPESTGGETCDSALVPFKTKAWALRCDSSFDSALWLRQNGAGDIEVLEPMRGRSDREQMRAGLDKDMARDWQRRRLSLTHRALPPRYSANLHDVQHGEIRSAGRHRLGHVAGKPPIFTGLNWHGSRRSHASMPLQILGFDRLFDPTEVKFR